MLTIPILLLVGAFIITLVSAMGKIPLWPAVLLVVIYLLLGIL